MSTHSPDLSALIARLEAATEGSRELDEEIWLAAVPGATLKVWSYVHTASGKTCEVRESRGPDRRLIIVPSYTTSLDAADSLGGQPSLATYQRKYSYGRPYCIASVPVFRRSVQICIEVAERADFHLALAAATAHLKARQVQP